MGLHVGANKGEIADKLILTDDPMRVKMIVANYLENAKCHNEIRSMFGYTGTYNDKKISVQSVGIGAPSMSIYANELLNEHCIKSIIWVGTCTSVSKDLRNRDVVLVMDACTDSAMAKSRFGDIKYGATADFDLLSKAYQKSMTMRINAPITKVFSTDLLHNDTTIDNAKLLSTYDIKAFDMETYELYTLAARHKVKAVSILTISDEFLTGNQTGSAERQSTFHDMIKLAFETIIL